MAFRGTDFGVGDQFCCRSNAPTVGRTKEKSPRKFGADQPPARRNTTIEKEQRKQGESDKTQHQRTQRTHQIAERRNWRTGKQHCGIDRRKRRIGTEIGVPKSRLCAFGARNARASQPLLAAAVHFVVEKF